MRGYRDVETSLQRLCSCRITRSTSRHPAASFTRALLYQRHFEAWHVMTIRVVSCYKLCRISAMSGRVLQIQCASDLMMQVSDSQNWPTLPSGRRLVVTSHQTCVSAAPKATPYKLPRHMSQRRQPNPGHVLAAVRQELARMAPFMRALPVRRPAVAPHSKPRAQTYIQASCTLLYSTDSVISHVWIPSTHRGFKQILTSSVS